MLQRPWFQQPIMAWAVVMMLLSPAEWFTITVRSLKLGTDEPDTDLERNKVTTIVLKTVKNETVKAEKTIMQKSIPENPEMIKMRSYVDDLQQESTLLYSSEIAATKESITLYDLAADYSESTDLFPNPYYDTVVQELFSRATAWADYMAEPYVPEITGRDAKFSTCGGICPWIDYDLKSYSDNAVESLYKVATAPHIVFMMVDDWGWNDLGSESTYMSFTTPNIDRMVSEGVMLSNYFTHSTSIPSRGAFLTGRFSVRLGLSNYAEEEMAELPPDETTLAQELQSAGYKTYLVGKWQLGYSTKSQLPTRRGFDMFYGFLDNLQDHWMKTSSVQGNNFYDLQDGETVVTDLDDASKDLHSAHLMQNKVEAVITQHAQTLPDQPMFLFYSMPLMGKNWKAPAEYQQRCTYPAALDVVDDKDAVFNYCALNVMLDETVANVTCALRANGMGDNTIMVLVSDNGCDADTIVGCSYPFAGSQSTHARGGVSSRAIINSQLIPESRRGTVYEGLAHVTDWLPTLMGLATEEQWTGSFSGADLDGVDLWNAIVTNTESPRHEILHELKREDVSIQIDNMKLDASHVPPIRKHKPDYTFTTDADPTLSRMVCEWPSLWSYKPTPIPSGAPSKPPPPTPAPSQAPKPKATPPTNAPSNAPKPKTSAPSVAAKAAEAPKSSGGVGATSPKASPATTTATVTATVKTSTSATESTSVDDPVAQLLADAVASFAQGEPSSGGKSELELGYHASVASESGKESSKDGDGGGSKDGDGGGSKDGDGKDGGEASKSHTAESTSSASSSSKNDDTKQSGPKTTETTTEVSATATASDATSSDGATSTTATATSTTPELTLSQLEAILSATGTTAAEVTMDQLESIQAIFTDSSASTTSTTDTAASSSEVMESSPLMTASAHEVTSTSTHTAATAGASSETHNAVSASTGSGSATSTGTSGSGVHSTTASAAGTAQSASASTGANAGSTSAKGGSTQAQTQESTGASHSESGSGSSSAGSSGGTSKGASSASEGGGSGGGSSSTGSSSAGGASNGATSHSTSAGGSSSTAAGSVGGRYSSLVQTGGSTYTTSAHIQLILGALLIVVGMAVMVSRHRQSSNRNAKHGWWGFGDTENTRADFDSIDTTHKVSNNKTDHVFDVIDYESGRVSGSGSTIGYGAVDNRGVADHGDDDTNSSLISEQSRLLEATHDTNSRIKSYSS